MLLAISTLSTISRCLLIDQSKQRVLFSNFCEQSSEDSLSSSLSSCLTEALTHTKSKLGDIKAIYVFTGPGTFTGLRIGVNFAKGLSISSQIPLYGIPTKLLSNEKFYIPMRPLIAKNLNREELQSGAMEFLKISPTGDCKLEKPGIADTVLGSSENWDWPTEQAVLVALQKYKESSSSISIDYGINPKINGQPASY